MTTLETDILIISVRQREMRPAWVDFQITEKGKTFPDEFRFRASDFLTFVAWLSAEAKNIRTDREIEQEWRENQRG